MSYAESSLVESYLVFFPSCEAPQGGWIMWKATAVVAAIGFCGAPMKAAPVVHAPLENPNLIGTDQVKLDANTASSVQGC